MNTKELRQGNSILVSLPGNQIRIPDVETKVQGITIFGEVECLHSPQNNGFTIEPNHCMGIELTDDRFFKAGFLKQESTIVNTGWTFERPDFGGFYKENDFWIPRPFYFDAAFSGNFQLKYLHQLQNLFFILTGKELE